MPDDERDEAGLLDAERVLMRKLRHCKGSKDCPGHDDLIEFQIFLFHRVAKIPAETAQKVMDLISINRRGRGGAQREEDFDDDLAIRSPFFSIQGKAKTVLIALAIMALLYVAVRQIGRDVASAFASERPPHGMMAKPEKPSG